jgi:fatty-acid desaturase
MRPDVFRVNATGADPSAGRVVWAPAKSLWNMGCLLLAVVLAPIYATPSAIVLFALLTYTTLLLGHSVGMHRLFIHQTFDCPKWLERSLVYIGVLVGMAGPFGILRVHDVRDWAQREPQCHDFFAHRRSLLVDALWQLNCRFEFEHPPVFKIAGEIANDPWYVWMERTWMLQQIPLAVLLYILGGLSWVVWGIFVRVFVSNAGHWTVTYLTHNPGPGNWFVPSAGVQASNLTGFGLITMGECWHNNHHAFPESARVGLLPGQTDPGWWVIRTLQRLGLVARVGLPRDTANREDIVQLASSQAIQTSTGR